MRSRFPSCADHGWIGRVREGRTAVARLALGADAGSVLRLVVGRGARLALVGIALGVLGALGLTRFLTGMLYGVTPTDPAAYASVVTLIVGAVLLASYVPARRALTIPPAVTLRAE